MNEKVKTMVKAKISFMRKVLIALLSVMLVFSAVVLFTPATETVQAAWDGVGNGTAESPYQIGTAAQLKKFRDIVNGTNGEQKNATACAELTADIDLACSENDQWIPIGALDEDFYFDYDTNEVGYLGVFDGKGHTISGLYYNDTDNTWENVVNDHIGLFGVVGSTGDDSGIVRNLTVAGSLAADNNVGGIAGVLYGTVDNCVNNVTVTGDQSVGGIVGKAMPGSVIRRSTNNGALTGYGFLGGIAGYNLGYYDSETTLSIPGLVVNCANYGTLNATSHNYIGGIVGYLHSYVSIVYCHNAGAITVSSTNEPYDSSVGGIVGRCGGVDENGSYEDAQALVENCYNTGDITAAKNASISGIVGTAGYSAMIRCCLNYGTLTITANTSSQKRTYGGVASRSFYSGNSATVKNVYYKEGTAQFDGNATKKNTTELKDKETFKDTNSWSTTYYLDFDYCWEIGDEGPVLKDADTLDVAYAISKIKRFINYSDYHFPDDGPMIYAAKKAYELLSDEQKATIPEESGNKLAEAVTVYAVLEKIHSVGKIYYSTDVKARLDAAQGAYDALSVEWKQRLPEYEVSDLAFYQKQYANVVVLYSDLGGQGIGSDEDPFLISTKEQLARINDVISASYKLVCDIDAECDADNQWVPIGTYQGSEDDSYKRWSPYYEVSECRGFTGVLDGDGHTVSNLYIDVSDKVDDNDYTYYNHYASLIYSIGIGGKVKNLTVEGTFIGKSYVGGIAAMNNGIIDGCVNRISITGIFYLGGIAGYNSEQIINCKNFASVTGATEQEGMYTFGSCGGIVGVTMDKSIVKNCTNSGDVIGRERIGGIAGYCGWGQVWNCSNSGNVTGYTRTGGIVGYLFSPTDWFDFPVEQCFNTGTIVGTSDYTGGIVGQIEKPYGVEETGIENTYNIGSIQGTDYVGGLIGNLPYGCKIRVSHNVGEVSGTGSNVGQLTGKQESGSEVSISYYRSDTDTNNYAMTTEQFKNLSNFGGNTGYWKNGEVWMEGDDYPIFISAEMVKAREVSTYIGDIGSVSYTSNSKEKIDAAKKAYDQLTEEEKALIPQDKREALEKAINDYNAVDAVVQIIDAIGDVSYPDSKDAIDEAKNAVLSLTNDQKTILGDYENTLKEAEVEYAKGAIDAIGEVSYPGSKDAIDLAKDAIADFDEDQLALVSNLSDLEDAEKLYDAMDKINAIGEVSYPGSKDAIDAAKDAVAALDEGQLALVDNLDDLKDAEVEYAKGAIDAIGEVSYPGSKDAIDAAKDAIADLDEDQLALVSNLSDLEDAEKLYDAMGKIDAIGVVTYPGSKDAIDAAKDAIAALDEDQLALVSNLDDLYNAEIAFVEAAIDAIGEVTYPGSKDAIDLAKDMIDNLDEDKLALVSNLDDLYNAEIAFVEAAINAIGEVIYPDSKEQIIAAREAYDAIDDQHKQNVDNYGELVNAEEEFVENVEALIEAIGTVEYSEECEEKIDAANEAYGALSEHLKSLVDNADVLTQANDDYYSVQDAISAINAIGPVYYVDEIKGYIDYARELVDGLSDYQESIISEEYLKILVDDEAVYDEMGKITAISIPLENTVESLGKVQTAKDTFDALTDDQITQLGNSYISELNDALAALNAIKAVNAIGDVEYTQESKDKIDNAKALIEALTGKQDDFIPESVLKDLSDKETVYDLLGLIDAIGTPENTAEFRERIGLVRDAYDVLTADQKALISENTLKVLTDGEALIPVMDLIGIIGDVEYTPEYKAKTDDARDAYDALTADQKSIFPNNTLKTLVDGEKAYEFMDKVHSIGTIENTATCKGKIEEARKIYDALTTDQKGLVNQSFVKEFEDAEAAFNAIEKVNAIGDVKYTDDSKALIEEARSVYDELTDEQKKLIPVSVFDALEAAEVSYENTEKSAKTVSTVINILLSLILAGGIVVLVLLFRKRKEYDKDGGTKLMSVSALPLFLAANHYFDARFIILYILAVLAVAVWVADLILFLKRREGNKKAETEEVAPVKGEKAEQYLPDESSIPEKAVIETATVMKGKDTTFNIRYIKSFTAKLIQSDDETKAFYGELKNAVLSYGNTTSKISWQYDSVYCGRKPVLKFGIRGKTLCVYFALDVKDLKATKYKVELCESKKYALVPCMYRIKNAHRCELAKDLIAMAAEKIGLVKSERQNVEYAFPYEDNAALLKKGLIKELKKRADKKEAVVEKHHTVSVSEADAQMTDEVAATYIEDDLVSKTHKGKKGIINIDTIGDNFDDGDTVDIEALWEKNLIPKSVGYVKVLARGTLGKKLVIDLQDYSIQAVKMVILEGGTVKRAK